ncbi:uncharacterized protein [Montipora capricornis]|uniref:uncharacterized protein isoform X1 n=1 Tax=Montipora capricornis TaxID=246305 RepID=UPI0035F1C2B5
MSSSDWKKRWLYDSKVEIPKTTKWRRRCENINHGISDDIRLGDVWEDLSSETIELGNNTSPFKRQRLLRDCLSNLPKNTSSSIIKPCERNTSYGNFCMQTENAEDLELCRNNDSPSVDSSNIGYHGSCNQTDMQDCDGIDETQTGDEKHPESSHQMTTAEALINPNVWQNMSCDNEFDENDFQPSPGPEMIDKLEYRFRRVKMDSEAIEDVYDGKLYKKYSSPGGFLSNPHNISFLGNSDGVALIKSTSYGVWPVYLIVNEIPPSERFRRSKCVFAGLWFGKGKPHFPTFLRPFSLVNFTVQG